LADALDRSHDSRIYDVQCREKSGVLNFDLFSDGDCENELFEVERKRELFEQAFNRILNFSVRRHKTGARG
jgi:hypothetical protein